MLAYIKVLLNEKKPTVVPKIYLPIFARELQIVYRISSFSFRGNYSFLNLEIQRSQYINVRKLFKGGNYSRVETI